MSTAQYQKIFVDGLWHQNTGLVVLLGLCPLLAVSNTVVNALGLGLASTVPGRSPLLDGFGLIAFASLCPIMTVMAYAQLSEWRLKQKKRAIEIEKEKQKCISS